MQTMQYNYPNPHTQCPRVSHPSLPASWRGGSPRGRPSCCRTRPRTPRRTRPRPRCWCPRPPPPAGTAPPAARRPAEQLPADFIVSR